MKRVINLIIGVSLIVMLLLASIQTVLAASDPLVLLQQISDQMIATLKKNRTKLQQNPKYIYPLVDRILVPHADLENMSRSVLTRDMWTKASAGQKSSFTREFKDVLVGTYAAALNAYTDETMEFDPIRGSISGKTQVYITSRIIRSDGPPVPISYRMVLKGGNWKVADLSVEGVSLLQSFRSQFADEIAQGKTMVQLIQELHSRNKTQQSGAQNS